jgi:flagellar protein FlgJ
LAISPPSDIVLDVARAVEPAGIEAARAELIKRGAGAVNGAATSAFSLGENGVAGRFSTDGNEVKTPDSYKKFEAMVLQTFIQNMLPKDAEDVYGKGVAGDMWKSMMAGKLADVMADRGGIGIADKMMGDHYLEGKKTVPVGPISGGGERAETDRQSGLSTALIEEMQRKIARSLSEDQSVAATRTKS